MNAKIGATQTETGFKSTVLLLLTSAPMNYKTSTVAIWLLKLLNEKFQN
jgi:hypothetical protein